MPSLYETLEIAQNASLPDIKRAYYRLALCFHPDKNPAAEATKKFQKIAFAYEILSDTSKRSTYDKCLKNNDTEDYDKGSSVVNYSFNTFFDVMFAHQSEELKQREQNAKTRINEVFGSFISMSEKQQLDLLRKNRGLLDEIYYGAEPAEYLRVVHLYPMSELIEELNGPQSPLRQLLRDFQPNRFSALLVRFSPEQRWSILSDLNIPAVGHVLSILIERHQQGRFNGDSYKDGDHDILTTMVLLPKIYFNELNQHIESLEKEKALKINAGKLASALRVLRDDLARDVESQAKNHKVFSEIQNSHAMKTLRETILMVRSVRTIPASNAMDTITRYEEYCLSKASVLPRVIATVIFAAIGLVVGALIGLLTCVSLGLGVLPLAVVGAALSGSVISAGISSLSGANSVLSKHSLFKPKLELDEMNVALSARKYMAAS